MTTREIAAKASLALGLLGADKKIKVEVFDETYVRLNVPIIVPKKKTSRMIESKKSIVKKGQPEKQEMGYIFIRNTKDGDGAGDYGYREEEFKKNYPTIKDHRLLTIYVMHNPKPEGETCSVYKVYSGGFGMGYHGVVVAYNDRRLVGKLDAALCHFGHEHGIPPVLRKIDKFEEELEELMRKHSLPPVIQKRLSMLPGVFHLEDTAPQTMDVLAKSAQLQKPLLQLQG